MPFQTLIHFKNDEETYGEVHPNPREAILALYNLLEEMDADPDDVQFAQIEWVD